MYAPGITTQATVVPVDSSGNARWREKNHGTAYRGFIGVSGVCTSPILVRRFETAVAANAINHLPTFHTGETRKKTRTRRRNVTTHDNSAVRLSVQPTRTFMEEPSKETLSTTAFVKSASSQLELWTHRPEPRT